MAQRNFNDIQSSQESSYNGPRFFSLKNDKDYAVVRFMHPNTESFQIFDTHSIKTSKFIYGKTVACARDPHDAIDKCPLCAAGYPVKQKIYINLIEYVKQDDGTIKPEAKVWERPMNTAYDLSEKINIYGPLDKSIFIITRHTPDPNNKQNTTYSIDYAPPQVYPDNIYVPAPELFENYSALGGALPNLSAEDMQYYLNTGELPAKNGNTAAPVQQAAPTPAAAQPYAPPVAPQATPAYNSVIPPWESDNPFPAAPTTGTPVTPVAPATTAIPAQPYAPNTSNPYATPGAPQRPVRYYA